MAALIIIPVELIWMICNIISHPNEENTKSHDWPDRSDGLVGLNALSQTCRRFHDIVEPILYARGVHCHHALPLAWAATKGNQGTLNKALAAGADTNHKFVVPMSPELWEIIVKSRQNTTHLANTDPLYWPSISKAQLEKLDDYERPRAEAATAGLSTLEVFPVDINGSVGVRYPDPFDPNNDLRSSGWYVREYTALHLAASAGHIHIINSLLDHGASLNNPAKRFCACPRLRSFIDTSGGHAQRELVVGTPLHVAICSSQLAAAKCLISRGTSMMTLGRGPEQGGGQQALHDAAGMGQTGLVAHILDTHPDIDVDEPDEELLTPLYHACNNGHWESTVPLLLARGADINACLIRAPSSSLGGPACTILAEACLLGHFDDALKLLDLGADPSIMFEGLVDDGSGPVVRLPLLHLCCMDYTRDGRPTCPESTRPNLARSKVIARLIAAGTSPETTMDLPGSHWSETPMTLAIRCLNSTAISALLANGAQATARNVFGRTLLMIALDDPFLGDLLDSPYCDWALLEFPDDTVMNIYRAQSRKIIGLLLDAGASLLDRDHHGNTAAHFFFRSPLFDDRGDAPQFLFAQGADPTALNNSGISALRLAVQYGALSSLQQIALQGKVDLVKAFPMYEIHAIFNALTCSVWRSQLHLEVIELLQALVDMDRSGALSSNVEFICKRLQYKPSYRLREFKLVELLCYKALNAGSLATDAKLTILGAAIRASCWEVVYILLREVDQASINALDAAGQTPLALAFGSQEAQESYLPMQLILAGAELHCAVTVSLDGLGDNTPLKRALVTNPNIAIRTMLEEQPIKGNPQAAAQQYLHFVVNLPWCDAWDGATRNKSQEDPKGPPIPDTVLQELLIAGAYPTEVDGNGNTPLSRLVQNFLLDNGPLLDMVHWLRPLSRGVDVNQKNKEGLSVCDWLHHLLLASQDSEEISTAIGRILELRLADDGNHEIVWKR